MKRVKHKATKTIFRPVAKTGTGSGTEPELRRWCIEQAIRWPTEGSYASAVSGGGYGGARSEADVIGRAERLRKWVTSAASE
jgi:hypothetical protein